MHGCQRGSCQIRQLDLSSLASVQKFTEQFAAQQLHADVLICNAGTVNCFMQACFLGAIISALGSVL